MILISGATSNNGGEIIVALVAMGRRDVRAPVRDPDKDATKVSAFPKQGGDVAQGDLAKPEALRPAMAGNVLASTTVGAGGRLGLSDCPGGQMVKNVLAPRLSREQ